MNNSRSRLIILGAAAVALISLVAAGVILGTSGIFTSKSILAAAGSVPIDQEKTYAVSSVNSIRAFSTSTDIQFHESGGNEIRFHLHGTSRSSNEDRVTKLVERSSGRNLEVGAEPPRGVLRSFSSDLTLDVYLPRSYSGDLAMHSVSGDINLPFGGFGDLTMKTTSGEIDASGVSGESLDVDTTSGDIEISNASFEELTAKSTSGDVTTMVSDLTGDLEIVSTSGDVELSLPKGEDFDLSVKSTSGDISCDFSITVQGSTGGPGNKRLEGVVGDGGPDVSIRTVSGDVDIRN